MLIYDKKFVYDKSGKRKFYGKLTLIRNLPTEYGKTEWGWAVEAPIQELEDRDLSMLEEPSACDHFAAKWFSGYKLLSSVLNLLTTLVPAPLSA